MLSTGSPLLPEGFDYVYQNVKSDVQLASISGGTDIVSCFALGCPIRPVYRGEIQCRGLGMAVDIFDDAGRALRGERGELVCTAPFPSMPLGFWHDPGGERYRAAYFERFPGVWHHGDYAAITAHDGLVIYGRSDAVLNPGGVRIGTAEIYSAVESLPQIAEALAVGQDWQGDVRVVLFVRLQPGVVLDEALKKELRATIRAHTTARHVPAKIIAVPDIPRTPLGQDHRARGAQRHPRAGGEERRCARQSAGARALPRSARPQVLTARERRTRAGAVAPAAPPGGELRQRYQSQLAARTCSATPRSSPRWRGSRSCAHAS